MTAYRDRKKPAATLLRFLTTESTATLDDMREGSASFAYVVDFDGFAFKRHIREDGAPTRWQKLISPNRPEPAERAYATAAKLLKSAGQRAETGPYIETDARDVELEAKRLHAAWADALEKRRSRGTTLDEEREQTAHDELVDYIEANGLNGTTYDPRNDS